jgi:predicted DNA-binding transcriptional regulator AlpA
MNNRIIKARPERQGLLPMGETTIWDKVRAGEFPTPIKTN